MKRNVTTAIDPNLASHDEKCHQAVAAVQDSYSEPVHTKITYKPATLLIHEFNDEFANSWHASWVFAPLPAVHDYEVHGQATSFQGQKEGTDKEKFSRLHAPIVLQSNGEPLQTSPTVMRGSFWHFVHAGPLQLRPCGPEVLEVSRP